jgi:hypothetical protein
MVHIDLIRNSLEDHRVVNHLFLYENVAALHGRSEATIAITYMDYAFYTVSNNELSQAVYNHIMDIMLVKFIDQYLAENN